MSMSSMSCRAIPWVARRCQGNTTAGHGVEGSFNPHVRRSVTTWRHWAATRRVGTFVREWTQSRRGREGLEGWRQNQREDRGIALAVHAQMRGGMRGWAISSRIRRLRQAIGMRQQERSKESGWGR